MIRTHCFLAKLIQKRVDENARVIQSQEEYRQRCEGLVNRFKTAKNRFEEVGALRSEAKARRDLIEAFIDNLRKQDRLVIDFDEQIWYSLVDNATVYGDEDVRFTFKDGTILNA